MDRFELRFCPNEPALAETAARMWLDELVSWGQDDPNPNRVPALEAGEPGRGRHIPEIHGELSPPCAAHHDPEPGHFLGAPASLPANAPPAGMPALPGMVSGEPPFVSMVGRDSVEPWNSCRQKGPNSTESRPTQVHGKPHQFHVALSGGRITPQFFSAVVAESSRRSVSLDQVHFFWADERCVSPEHPESNYAAARRYLLDPLKIAPAHVHRIRAEADEGAAVTEAVDEFRRVVPTNPEGVPVLDLIFLGMGEDGHVASLFPNEPDELMESPSIYRLVRAPKPPPSRITLTYSVIAAARHVWVLASGAGKEKSLRESLSPSGKTPLGRVLKLRTRTLILTEIHL